MILKNSLYKIVGKTTQERVVCYDIALDATHAIYQAHFPGEPITPGVCLVQMTQELVEDHLHQPCRLCGIRNVKFLSVVSPADHPRVTYRLEKLEALSPTDYRVVAQVSDPVSALIFAKLSLHLRKI
jgi:3-hydroxyacyl-[acyl-carrier-protein] dehydratase